MEIPSLPIHDLAERHSGLTRAIAETCLEATRVCLDRHHIGPVVFSISNDADNGQTLLHWSPSDDQCRRAWANEIDCTEMGACGCSLAATELKRGLVAVHRAETGTGADYYLSPIGEAFEDLENCWRLEVSGTNRGNHNAIKYRLQQKVDQARSGNSNLPALATVVGFEAKVIAIQTVDDL